MCLLPPLCCRVAVMVVEWRTYHCRRRHFPLLLSCLILSISVGLTFSILFAELVSVCTWIVRWHCCFVILLVRSDGRFVLNCTCLPSRAMLLLRWWVAVLNSFSKWDLWRIVGLFMTLRSSSASLMAVLMISASLSLFLIIYLFIWLFLFSWRLMDELSLNLLSVLVVWSFWLGLAEKSARRE